MLDIGEILPHIPAGRQGTRRLHGELSCSFVIFGKDPAGNVKSMTTPEMSSYTQQCYLVCSEKYSQRRTKKYEGLSHFIQPSFLDRKLYVQEVS